MTHHVQAQHSITIALPVRQCQMLFTPAGEELWVEGWRPTYHRPRDGSTEKGMIFSTGSGDEYTLWSLVDFDRGDDRYYARYARVTPALRSGFVDVRCTELSARSTRVDVGYEMTALTTAGEASLAAYEPRPLAAMIEEWRSLIEARLPDLSEAQVR